MPNDQYLNGPTDGTPEETRLPIVRALGGGVLMGLANLVPGVSGGTMILVTGLYDEFISAVADVTRLRFTRRNVLFLGIVAVSALIAIATLAGTLSRAVTLHQSAMYSLFIGLTLGGAPLLLRMLGRLCPTAITGIAVGLAMMLLIALTREEPPDRAAVRAAVASGEFVIHASYGRDLLAGLLSMSAMVLPGVSGAYMLLVLDRYETILAAIAVTKTLVVSFGRTGSAADALHVLAPFTIGAILSLVLLSNFLKWLLHRHERLTLGILLGILLGSVIGIWPFDHAADAGAYVTGGLLAAAGFAATALLARISA